jgi:hypothetical protein
VVYEEVVLPAEKNLSYSWLRERFILSLGYRPYTDLFYDSVDYQRTNIKYVNAVEGEVRDNKVDECEVLAEHFSLHELQIDTLL